MTRREREYPSVHDYDDYRLFIVDWLKVWGLPRANFARQAVGQQPVGVHCTASGQRSGRAFSKAGISMQASNTRITVGT